MLGWSFHGFDTPADREAEARHRKEKEEAAKRDAEERAAVDKAFPPETEATFEELLAEMPPIARQRLERASAYLRGTPIPQDERIAYVADTIELLEFIKYNIPSAIRTDYSFRRWRYRAEKGEEEHDYRFDTLGSDARNPEIQKQRQSIEMRAAKIARSRWRAAEVLFHEAFPEESLFSESLTTIISNIQRQEMPMIDEMESKVPPKSLAAIPESVRDHILRNTFSVELTEGCSVRCTFCAFNATPGVRESMPFEDVTWVISRVNKEAFLYYATDPLDYRTTSNDSEYTYEDVLNVYILRRGHAPFTATAVPKKNFDVFTKVIDRVHRISISQMNQKLLLQQKIIERTPGGTILPANPDVALQFWEHVSRRFFEPELYYFDPNRETDVRNIYRAGRQRAKSRPENQKDDNTIEGSIACRDGVIISPNRIKNSLRMMTTEEFPNGVAEANITVNTLENGAQDIEELQRNIERGLSVSITSLLPHVIISYKISTNGDVKITVPGTKPIGPQSDKKTSTLSSRCKFRAFRTVGEAQIPFEGTCEFDRVSGAIRSITLEQMPA